jgi:uncharacterized lipoprotein YajG
MMFHSLGQRHFALSHSGEYPVNVVVTRLKLDVSHSKVDFREV